MGVMSRNDWVLSPDVVSRITETHEDCRLDDQTKQRWVAELRRTRDRAKRRNPESVFLPANTGVNTGTHWILLQIQVVRNRLVVYDSADSVNAEHELVQRVARWWNDDTGEDPLNVTVCTHCVKQQDGYNCGPMVCLNLRRLMLIRRRPRTRRDWGYDSGQADQWRWHIITELAKDDIRPGKDGKG